MVPTSLFKSLAYLGAAAATAALLVGCLWEQENKRRLNLGVDPAAAKWADSAAYRDTIGAYTYPDGLRPLRVRGIGLVVGLGRNGSRHCPRKVRDELVERLHKQYRFVSDVVGVAAVSPETLISDIDTAVVVVDGGIPPGAVPGVTFEVQVRALPGTQTKSLRGGRLFSTELMTFQRNQAGAVLTGTVLAKAAGPLFLNPFADEEAATKVNVLEGVVLGGGRALKERMLRLVLLEPSHGRARRIQDRINNRFPDARKIADAISPSFVEIRVPDEFEDDAAHALALIRSLYLSSDPMFEAARARLLAREIPRPGAPHAMISLCLEGLGRSALPVLADLYAHRQDYVSFHASVAGVRLGEHLAAEAVARHAGNPGSTYRFQAIEALARARGMAAAAHALRDLLEDPDPRVRVAAYQALLKRGDPSVETTPIGGDNFLLDVVASGQEPIVFVRRTGSRRVALIGSDLRCRPPLHYVSLDGGLTVNAYAEDKTLTLVRVALGSGSRSDPIAAPVDLLALIRLLGSDVRLDRDGRVVGLGVDHGAIVRLLQTFARDGSIDARFVLEQPNAAELFGPARPQGRPESDL